MSEIYIDKQRTTQGPSCPFCANEELSLDYKFEGVRVHCDQCFAHGPVSDTWQVAVRLWTERKGR
jgi:transcription elongation factor Elf1